jgi:hypothetical protein
MAYGRGFNSPRLHHLNDQNGPSLEKLGPFFCRWQKQSESERGNQLFLISAPAGMPWHGQANGKT